MFKHRPETELLTGIYMVFLISFMQMLRQYLETETDTEHFPTPVQPQKRFTEPVCSAHLINIHEVKKVVPTLN